MSRPVITRRRLVAGGAAALGAAALPVGIIEALAAERPCTGLLTPAAFDPAAFLADLKAAGCRVCLALPATVFRPDDRWRTYFIAPNRGYCAVMAKWSDAIEACPDHVDLVTARLAEMRGVVL